MAEATAVGSRITLPAFAAKAARLRRRAIIHAYCLLTREKLVTGWPLPVLPLVILCCSRYVCVLLLRYLVRHEELSSIGRLFRDLKSFDPPLASLALVVLNTAGVPEYAAGNAVEARAETGMRTKRAFILKA